MPTLRTDPRPAASSTGQQAVVPKVPRTPIPDGPPRPHPCGAADNGVRHSFNLRVAGTVSRGDSKRQPHDVPIAAGVPGGQRCAPFALTDPASGSCPLRVCRRTRRSSSSARGARRLENSAERGRQQKRCPCRRGWRAGRRYLRWRSLSVRSGRRARRCRRRAPGRAGARPSPQAIDVVERVAHAEPA